MFPSVSRPPEEFEMKQRPLLALATLSILAPLAPAQESRALFDAPVIELGSRDRIEALFEYDGTPGYEAASFWWTDNTFDFIALHAWDIDPQTGFELLWEMIVPETNTNVGGSLGIAALVPAAVKGPGRDDLILVTSTTMRVYLKQDGPVGAGAPVLSQTMNFAYYIYETYALDVDGDGDDDLVTRDWSDLLRLYENRGEEQGWYEENPNFLIMQGTAGKLRVGELTGDATPDLVFVRTDAVVIQPLAPDFSFLPEVAFPLSSWTYNGIATIGDIDGDGDEDVVAFAPQNGTYSVLRNVGASRYVLGPEAIGGPATYLVDLDGDGDLDGACCAGGGYASPYAWWNVKGAVFELCHNDGTGAFTPSFQMSGLGAERLAAAADIDFDGDVDLVAGRVVYYAPGPIEGPFEIALADGEHQGRLLRDWDADGDPDLRAGYEEVRRSDGTGDFEPMTPEMNAPAVSGLTFQGPGYAGDYDGDGDDDLIVAKFQNGTFLGMGLLANTGGGQLVDMGDASDPGVSFSKTGESTIDPRGGWSVDIDMDGDEDLITWAPQASSPNGTLWINDGTGTFQPSVNYDMTGKWPQGSGKFDANGQRDLIVTSQAGSGNNLSVDLLNGDGSLAQTVDLNARVHGELGSIAIGDFDDDGDTDLVVCDQSSNQIARTVMFQNDGAASFLEIDLGVEGPERNQRDGLVIRADVNGDGWSDLIVSPLAQAKTGAAILLRNPDGVMFQPPVLQVIRPYQARDLDGDGDPDLVDGQFDDDDTIDDRIVKNRRVEGASSGWRLQVGSGVAGTGSFTPTLGVKMFGGYSRGDGIKYKLTGTAPGVTGRLLITEVPAVAAASTYAVTGTPAGTLPSDRALTKNFTRVIDLVTSGDPSDPPGTGEWHQRHLIGYGVAGRTFLHWVEIDDPAAPNGMARTNDLYVRYAD